MEHIDISAIVLTDTLDPDRLGLVVTAVAQPQYIEEHICLRNIPYVSLAKEVEAACLITLKRHEVGSSFVAEEKLRHAQYINPSRDPDPPFFVAVATVQTNDGDLTARPIRYKYVGSGRRCPLSKGWFGGGR